jgi:predicted Holliday junction resolvase-like endonuclease
MILLVILAIVALVVLLICRSRETFVGKEFVDPNFAMNRALQKRNLERYLRERVTERGNRDIVADEIELRKTYPYDGIGENDGLLCKNPNNTGCTVTLSP